MKHHDTHAAARNAVSSVATRPPAAMLHDAHGVRLVVFRIEPGLEVAPHTSDAQVILTVLEGHGTIIGPESTIAAGPGDVITYAPNELHGMRADRERFCILATIARTA